MRRFTRSVVGVLLLVSANCVWAYPWDQDMVDQPSVKPQEAPSPAAPEGIPINGGETMPAPTDEQGMADAKSAAAAVPNPVPVTTESIDRGRALFEVNCLICHGAQGRGDGPVADKFVTKAPVDLNLDYTQDQADGQLYFTLTRGRGLMPFYRDALSEEERWHVINYLRHEFGKQ